MVGPSAALGRLVAWRRMHLDAIALLADHGVTTFEVTAIDRDGLLQGPDLDLVSRVVELDRGRIDSPRGITSKKDVRRGPPPSRGRIIGRALATRASSPCRTRCRPESD